MAVPFRSIDTAVRPGRKQIAFDQALVDLHIDGVVPDTLRFLRFPPTVLVGRHQAISREVKIDYCSANGVGLARRITGGGAIYLDENQVGWELVLSRRRLPMSDLAAYTVAICEAVACGLSEVFSIPASHRPRSDIVVDGQKICGTGGYFDGDTLIYQGTVLVDIDTAGIMACLNVPDVKPASRELDMAERRMTTLKSLLGSAPSVGQVHQALIQGLEGRLGIAIEPGSISQREEDLARKYGEEYIETDAFVFEIDAPSRQGFVSASRMCPGGRLDLFLRLEGEGDARRVREILLTGDFFVTPPRAVFDLEAKLRGVQVNQIEQMVDDYFARTKFDLITITADDLKDTLTQACS
ncbi:MAG: lipoate--protein ligase family protein [Hyphomicrobiaceae bacterium]